MLSKLMDVLFSVFIIIAILMVSVTTWSAIHQGDKRVQNQYKLVGDMLQGVIESPSEGALSRRQFLFNFVLKDNRPTFDGTIFGISSDGRWTTPVPPTLWTANTKGDEGLKSDDVTGAVNDPNNKISISAAKGCPVNLMKGGNKDKAPGSNACICLSHVPIKKKTDLVGALKGISVCRKFSVPDKKKFLILDFSKLKKPLVKGSKASFTKNDFPVVYLLKKTGGCDSSLAVQGTPSASLTRENSVCVYASLEPDFLP